MATLEEIRGDLYLLRAPWSGLPWSAVNGSVEYSTFDPLFDLRQFSGELAWMMRVEAWEPGVGIKNVYISSHGYQSGGDGTGAAEGVADFQHFPPGLINPGNIKTSIVSQGTIGNRSVPTFGTIRIANADGKFDYLKDLRLRQRSFTTWVGQAAWMGPTFSRLAKVSRGVIGDATWDDEAITLSVREPSAALQQDLNPDAYLGFGVAVRLRGEGDGVVIPGSWDLDELHIRLMIEVESLGNMTLVNMGWEDGGGAEGWELQLVADGGLIWIQGGSWDRYVTTDSGEIEPLKPHRVSLELGPNGVAIWVDGREAVRDVAPYVRVDAGGPDLILGTRASLVLP